MRRVLVRGERRDGCRRRRPGIRTARKAARTDWRRDHSRKHSELLPFWDADGKRQAAERLLREGRVDVSPVAARPFRHRKVVPESRCPQDYRFPRRVVVR